MNYNAPYITIRLIVIAIILPLSAVYANQQPVKLHLAANTTTNMQDPTMPKMILNNNTDQNTSGTDYSQNSNDNLQLTMIVVSNEDKTALINEQTVREQDVIGNYKVIEIAPNKVKLKAINPEQQLSIGPENNQGLITELKLPAVTIKQ